MLKCIAPVDAYPEYGGSSLFCSELIVSICEPYSYARIKTICLLLQLWLSTLTANNCRFLVDTPFVDALTIHVHGFIFVAHV